LIRSSSEISPSSGTICVRRSVAVLLLQVEHLGADDGEDLLGVGEDALELLDQL